MSIKHKNVIKQSEYATSVYSSLFFRGGGGTYFRNLNLKTHCFTYCGGSHVPVGIVLLYLCLSLSLSKSQIIFVLFVVISSNLCCCFKAVSLVRILLYPSRASQWPRWLRWNPDIINDPRYNDVPGIKMNILCGGKSYGKMYAGVRTSI